MHTCCQHFQIIHATRSDQLYYTIIKSRTMNASNCSTIFKIHKLRGTFNEIDRCSITNYGNFDFNSKLLHYAEARAITKHSVLDAPFTNSAKEKVLS